MALLLFDISSLSNDYDVSLFFFFYGVLASLVNDGFLFWGLHNLFMYSPRRMGGGIDGLYLSKLLNPVLPIKLL